MPHIDPLSGWIALVVLVAGATGAARWREAGEGWKPRALPALLLLALLAAALGGGGGVTWIALAAAVPAAAAALAFADAGAAVRFFLLAAVGLALAACGAVLLFLGRDEPGISAAGYAFALVGYGALAGLPPLHLWRGRAEAAAPPLLAALLGAVPAVGWLPLLRVRAALAAQPAAIAPGPALQALGLAALLLASFALPRQRDPRRRLALASVAQGGVAALAFGLGDAAADAAGMLHLAGIVLARAAVLSASPDEGRAAALTAAGGIAAFAMLPPSALFASTMLIVGETARRAPWLLPPLALGLVACGWSLAAALLGGLPAGRTPMRRLLALLPGWLALAASVLLGIGLPGPAGAWFGAIAAALR